MFTSERKIHRKKSPFVRVCTLDMNKHVAKQKLAD